MLDTNPAKAAAFKERQTEGTGLGSVKARMWRRLLLEGEFQQRQPDTLSEPTPRRRQMQCVRLLRCRKTQLPSICFCDIDLHVEDKITKGVLPGKV